MDQNLLVAPSSEGGETMGNRPVIEVTTGLAGEFLGLRYKSGSVVPWALDLTVWSGVEWPQATERNGAGFG
jgi:hypothetical protein